MNGLTEPVSNSRRSSPGSSLTAIRSAMNVFVGGLQTSRWAVAEQSVPGPIRTRKAGIAFTNSAAEWRTARAR